MIDEEKKQYEGTNEDYYNSLQNESYKAMLSKEVQASVAADQARKYTQNALAAQGLGTQGIAQSTQLGISNQYRNALFSAQDQYEQDLMGINQQRREAYENDFQNAVGSFDLAESQDDMDLYMKLMGYMDTDGNIKQGVPEQIVNAYNAYLGRLNKAEEQAATETVIDLSKYSSEKTFAYKDGKGEPEKTQRLRNEYKSLKEKIDAGLIKDAYVELVSENGYHAYVYVDKNGRTLVLTPDQYAKAEGNKQTIGKDKRSQPDTSWQTSEKANKVPVGAYVRHNGMVYQKTKDGWKATSKGYDERLVLYTL